MKIITEYWKKPIPDRNHDWVAWDEENPETGSASGLTEEQAIQNYKDLYCEDL